MSRRPRPSHKNAQKDVPNLEYKERGINSLPVELLAKIFRLHVLSNHDSPVTIVLVCHRWNAIAMDTQVLWTRILFGDPDRAYYFDDFWRFEDVLVQMRSMVICPNAPALSRALTRIGNRPFELTIFPTSIKEYPQSKVRTRRMALKQAANQNCDLTQFSTLFSTSCRCLRIFSLRIIDDLLPLFANMTALEEFELPLTDPWLLDEQFDDRFDFKTLQKDVMRHSPKFTKLLNSKYAFSRDSLGCLKTLGLRRRDYVKDSLIFKDVVAVEELVFTALGLIPFEVWLGDTLPALRKLKFFGDVICHSPKIFPQITHLVLSYSFFDNGGDKFTFPALKTLIVESSWEAICAIDAPNLYEMRIYGDPNISETLDISFCPEFLHIEDFLGQGFEILEQLAGPWANVKRLHLTVPFNIIPEDIIDPFLSLCQCDPRTKVACPRLESISILFPIERHGRSRNEPENRSLQTLLPINEKERTRMHKQIMAVLNSKRGKVWMRGLKSFRYGLFILEQRGNHFIESRRWWRTEWKDVK